MMRILAIDDKQSGCYWYRTKLPLDEVRKKGHFIYITKGEGAHVDLDQYDIVIINRSLSGNFKEVVSAIKKKGKKLVFDTDDAMDLIPNWSPCAFSNYDSYYYLLKNADLVTTTTDTLASHLRKYTSSEVKVIPNCINQYQWGHMRSGHDRLRIGYAGTSTHIKDSLVILKAVKELKKSYDFDFYLFGFSVDSTSSEDWTDEFLNLEHSYQTSEFIDAVKEYKDVTKDLEIVFVNSVSVHAYPLYLAYLGFDIGLCPLENSEFNSMKSCVKFYEYAMADIPCIASRVAPYDKEVNYLADNTVADWEKKIAFFLDNKNKREEIASIQRDWVIENRDIRNYTRDRIKAYESIL